MADISVEDIKKLADLSKLSLTKNEIEQYRGEIEKILAYVEQLNNVDTSGIEPTSQVTGLTNVTRKDEAMDYCVDRQDLLKNAPDQADGYLKVKRVL